jgi:hypothetical protein
MNQLARRELHTIRRTATRAAARSDAHGDMACVAAVGESCAEGWQVGDARAEGRGGTLDEAGAR